MTKRKSNDKSFHNDSKKKKKDKHRFKKDVSNMKDTICKFKEKKRKKTTTEKEIRTPATMQSILNEKLEKAKANRLNHGKTKDDVSVDSELNVNQATKHEDFASNNTNIRKDDQFKLSNSDFNSDIKIPTETSNTQDNVKKNKKKGSKGIEIEKSIGNASEGDTDAEKANKHEGEDNDRDTQAELGSKDNKTSKRKKKEERQPIQNEENQTNNSEPSQENEEDVDPEVASMRKRKREKRRLKRLEKQRRKREHKEKAGTAKVAAVEYLKQWKNAREDWKFQKVRQVWLLKNIYDISLLNDDSFEILLEYLEGLKGVSREKTVSEAETMLEKSETEEDEAKVNRARSIIQLLSDG